MKSNKNIEVILQIIACIGVIIIILLGAIKTYDNINKSNTNESSITQNG